MLFSVYLFALVLYPSLGSMNNAHAVCSVEQLSAALNRLQQQSCNSTISTWRAESTYRL